MIHALTNWAAEDGGRHARTTVYHAAQLFTLVKIGTFPQDAPLDPMCIYDAALVLLCYIYHGPQPLLPTIPTLVTNLEVEGGLELARGVIQLDNLVDHSDPHLLHWLATGLSSPCIEEVGDLQLPGAAHKVVGICTGILGRLKVWGVGKSLAESLSMIGGQLRPHRI